jgi:hypothetical protein
MRNEEACSGQDMVETQSFARHEQLTHQFLPKLKHFDKENIHVTMYATQWLLTQYTSNFKFDLLAFGIASWGEG